MRVLFIGDIVGSPGRQIVHDRLADLVEHRQIDLVIANGENSASGFGITPRIAEGLLQGGIRYAVLNLQGRVFLPAIDDPFKKADSELAKLPPDVAFVLVDMHAETTSEKIAMGWYLDGRVTAVVGTHTHVPTADEHVLPGGTAYITDVGMTGPHDGVIGMDRAGIVKKFLDGLPARFEVATGDVQMNAVLVETDDTGPRSEAGRLRAKSIERLRLRAD
jgi:hypothetical protein